MIFEADGTVYSGSFAFGVRDGFGVEKTPDGAVYEGPFNAGRRHGVGLVTTMVPITVDPSQVWDGHADSNWIGEWTDNVPAVRGNKLKVRAVMRESPLTFSDNHRHLPLPHQHTHTHAASQRSRYHLRPQ